MCTCKYMSDLVGIQGICIRTWENVVFAPPDQINARVWRIVYPIYLYTQPISSSSILWMQPTQNAARMIQGTADTKRIDEPTFLELDFVYLVIIINHVDRFWIVKFVLMILILLGVTLIGIYQMLSQEIIYITHICLLLTLHYSRDFLNI